MSEKKTISAEDKRELKVALNDAIKQVGSARTSILQTTIDFSKNKRNKSALSAAFCLAVTVGFGIASYEFYNAAEYTERLQNAPGTTAEDVITLDKAQETLFSLSLASSLAGLAFGVLGGLGVRNARAYNKSAKTAKKQLEELTNGPR